ncbi:MAG: hypothetical protein JWM82_4393 [Myxococcales bacterium]|nr:hypothetical protein [Myxococcales bacterium]
MIALTKLARVGAVALALAPVALVAGCGTSGGAPAIATGGARPDWIDKPSSDPRYPIERYVTARAAVSLKGLTEAEAAAKLDAATRGEVATQIAGKITAELNDVEKETLKNGKSTTERSIEQRAQQTVKDFDLTSIEIKERWRDGDTAYALGVLEKQKAVLLETPKLTDLVKSASEHLARGDALVDKDPGAGLGEYFRARQDGEKAWDGKSLIRALGGDAGVVPAPTEATEKLATLAGKIALVIESGGGQRVTDGKALPRPVVVLAMAGAAPVAGLPLAIELRGGRLQSKVRTGPDGRASVRVDDVGKFDTPEKPINVTLDWGGLANANSGAAPAWARALPELAAATTTQKKTKESTRVIVRISEEIMMSESGGDPKAVTEPPVGTAVMKALQDAGLKPVDAKALDAKLTDPAKAGDAELKEKAVGLADVLVIGTATSRESGKYGTKTVWHRARAELRVVDLGTGRVIATFTDEAKAKKPGEPDWAGRSALEALSEKLAPTVAPKLLKELGF